MKFFKTREVLGNPCITFKMRMECFVLSDKVDTGAWPSENHKVVEKYGDGVFWQGEKKNDNKGDIGITPMLAEVSPYGQWERGVRPC